MKRGLAAEGLSRHFGEHLAVDGIDLVVEPGQVHAIVGLNGAGKTTLMRLLMGMLRPHAGRALVSGADARTAPGAVWREVGHFIESPFAYPELTVRENALAAGRLHGLTQKAAGEAADGTLETFGLGRWSDRPARTLSLGNRQRLGLVTALAHEPSVVVLDEPANSLDPEGVVLVRGLLRDMSGRGAAVLVSSHHFDQLARVADSVTVIHSGRVAGTLDPDGLELEQRFFDLVRDADQAKGTSE